MLFSVCIVAKCGAGAGCVCVCVWGGGGGVVWYCGSQQTRHIYLMIPQCWANVVDGGPTLVKQWLDVCVCWIIPSSYSRKYSMSCGPSVT